MRCSDLFKSSHGIQRAALLTLAGCIACVIAPALHAASVDLGQASNFTVLGFNSLQDDFSLVTVNGNVGVADTSNLHVMAPSVVNGNVLVGSNASFSDDKPSNINGSVLMGQNLSGAVSDALSTFNTYTALSPTETFSGISSQKTITGNGGLNVIDVNGNISSGITLNGSSTDLFVINVDGSINLGGNSAILAGFGVSPNQVLINLIGNQSVNTHVGNTITGTVIAPNSSGTLDGTFNGRLFFGGNSLTLMSGAVVHGPSVVPAPATLLGSVGLLGLLALGRLMIKRQPVVA